MEDEARTTWIQGASRGLGLALTREALRRDPEVTVIATARQLDGSPGLDELELRAPGRLLRFACDASDPASVEAAVSAIAAAVPRLDAIWNVAGILQEGDHRPEKRLEQVRLESLERLFGVNAFGPLLVLRAALPLLPRDRTVHLVNLSARVGSIEDNRLGGWYGYRASKAALNMFVRTAAIELRRRLPRAICLAVHPGTVATELSEPFGTGERVDPETAAKRLLDLVERCGPESSGSFLAWDGSAIPW